jgi:hypothetical protein
VYVGATDVNKTSAGHTRERPLSALERHHHQLGLPLAQVTEAIPIEQPKPADMIEAPHYRSYSIVAAEICIEAPIVLFI